MRTTKTVRYYIWACISTLGYRSMPTAYSHRSTALKVIKYLRPRYKSWKFAICREETKTSVSYLDTL